MAKASTLAFVVVEILKARYSNFCMDDNFLTSFSGLELTSRSQERWKGQGESCVFSSSFDPKEFKLCVVVYIDRPVRSSTK